MRAGLYQTALLHIFFDFSITLLNSEHCFICLSTVSEDAGIEPRTVATTTLAVRRSTLATRLDLIHTRLVLIHARPDLIHFLHISETLYFECAYVLYSSGNWTLL